MAKEDLRRTRPRLAGYNEAMASVGSGDADYGNSDGPRADVALDSFLSLFRRGSDLQRNRRPHSRDGGVAEGSSSGRVSASAALPESREAAASDEPAVGILHLCGAAYHLVRE